MKPHVILLLISATLLFGCKKTEDPKPADPNKVTFTINHVWANNPFVFDTQNYITPGLDSVYFKRIAYLLSGFKLKNSNGIWVDVPDGYAYVDPTKSITTFAFTGIPAGQYDSLKFMIGLDSVPNFGDPNQWPSGHALEPVTDNLHWSWAQGYVFYAMEGYYFMPDQKLFSLHMAFLENRVHYAFPAEINIGKTKNITLQFDVREVFQNPHQYVIGEDGSFTHSFDDNGLANLLRDNLATAFTVSSIK